MQNVIYLGKDNPVIIDFSFTGEFADNGLSNFTDIQVEIGSESYSLSGNPSNVVVSSATELRILIGDTTSLTPAAYPIKVIGINAIYDDGYVLVGCGSISRVIVKDF